MEAGNWRFPAEWEKQQGILLCFPHNGKDWPGKYQAIQWAFVEIIKKIARVEEVHVLVAGEEVETRLRVLLRQAHVNLERVFFLHQRTNRSWMRDSGPLVVKRGGQRKALDFHFNGWAKYRNYFLDRQVPGAVAEHFGMELEPVLFRGWPVTLEGGALDVNGRGSLLTSEECLLDPEVQVRNPGLGKADYEEIFREWLGVRNVIWLGKGITGDDTHGHIDDLARFVNPTTIVTVVEEDPEDANYEALQENRKRLEQAVLEDGRRPDLVTLPMPRPLYFDGLRIPASYANFLILNRTVLVPTFNDPNDRLALNTLSACFPDREVIGIGAIDLIWGFGTLHCLSQQIPAQGNTVNERS
ncbi:MAG: agmatine deiminase family protein [Bacteroidales bacterium]